MEASEEGRIRRRRRRRRRRNNVVAPMWPPIVNKTVFVDDFTMQHDNAHFSLLLYYSYLRDKRATDQQVVVVLSRVKQTETILRYCYHDYIAHHYYVGHQSNYQCLATNMTKRP
jgi:hypothetical protein